MNARQRIDLAPLLDDEPKGLEAGVTEDDLKGVDAEVKRIVAEAAEFARTSPEPDPSELYTDVYLEAAE